MSIDQAIGLLVTITLIEMMVTIGLGATWAEMIAVCGNGRLLVGALLANYVCVPVATVALLMVFQAQPMVAAGFLILAVCPGAPFIPPLAALAKSDVPAAVGLMAILAATSAVVAPLLLHILLPVLAGPVPLRVDSTKLASTLVITQLAPLGVGLAVRHWLPVLAGALQSSANHATKVLSLLSVGAILATQYPMLATIRGRGLAGMTALLIVSLLAGWLLGGPLRSVRKTLALTTSLRNVGVSLVIATGAFAGTPAVTAVIAYGLFGIVGSLLLASWWGRTPTTIDQRIEAEGSPAGTTSEMLPSAIGSKSTERPTEVRS